jgi:hypothetical protein
MCVGLRAKYPLFLFDFNESLTVWTDFLSIQISNFMKIRRVGATSHAKVRTDTNDEANSSFSQFCERA